LLKQLLKRIFPAKEKKPAEGYDLWAAQYDEQPDNLMLAQDEILFSSLLAETDPRGKIIADIGCGTGRHWQKLQALQPAKLIGYDVSAGMLARLNEKYPGAETFLFQDDRLASLADQSVDILISTLTIAHIPDAEKAMKEWNRVLKDGGQVIITDYHPEALSKGGNRSFRYNNKTITAIAGQLGWVPQRLMEKEIDDNMRPWYEKQQAMETFSRFRGMPLIYGILLKKKHADT